MSQKNSLYLDPQEQQQAQSRPELSLQAKRSLTYLSIFLILIMLVSTLLYKADPSLILRKSLSSSLSYPSASASRQLNFTVTNLAGKKIELPYPSSIVLEPRKMEQPALVPLDIKDTTVLKEYLEKIQKMEYYAELFLNWKRDNITLFEAEYYRYNLTYDFDKPVPEKQICVLAPFKNLLKYGIENGTFNLFLKSVNDQNYSSYHVYMIDDASSDASSSVILSQLHKYPRLNNRITILKNRQKLGPLGNRDSTIRNYCKPGDIVVDVDGDDNLIGRQVFNLLNRVYFFYPDVWFLYTNFVQVQGDKSGDGRNVSINLKKLQFGFSKPIKQTTHEQNSYRTQRYEWVTSHTRTYLRDLYVKIPLGHVLERGTGRYFVIASDRFAMYALAELAGGAHTMCIQEFTYFYYQPNYVALARFECSLAQLYYCEAQARIVTPLKHLKNFTDPAQEVENYEIPQYTMEFYLRRQTEFFQCKEIQSNISDIYQGKTLADI